MRHKVGSRYTNVLPQAYTDAVSYYEEMCKLVAYVNENSQPILPTNPDGSIDWGVKGQIAVSNGVDSMEWLTVVDGNEERY